VDKYLDAALEHKRLFCRELVPTDRLSCVKAFTRLFDALAVPENGVGTALPEEAPPAQAGKAGAAPAAAAAAPADDAVATGGGNLVEMWFLFCLIWGLGGPLDEEGRKKFDAFMREMDTRCGPLLHHPDPTATLKPAGNQYCVSFLHHSAGRSSWLSFVLPMMRGSQVPQRRHGLRVLRGPQVQGLAGVGDQAERHVQARHGPALLPHHGPHRGHSAQPLRGLRARARVAGAPATATALCGHA
jgi:hypothetical protein